MSNAKNINEVSVITSVDSGDYVMVSDISDDSLKRATVTNVGKTLLGTTDISGCSADGTVTGGIKAACDGVDALDTELDSKTSTITLSIEANYGVLKVVKYGKVVSLSWSSGGTAQHIPTGESVIATGLPIPDAYVYPSMQGGQPSCSTLWLGSDAIMHGNMHLTVNHEGTLTITNLTGSEFNSLYSGAYMTYICQ